MTSVTVVIPVFNRQGQAEAAIASALSQQGCALEIIVIDDASTVAFTLPAALKADRRVRLIQNERNAGSAAARNTGIKAASHEWIAFLDSDDRFLPGKLQAQLSIADPNRPLDVLATGFVYARRASGIEQHLIPIEAGDLATFCAGCWHCPGSTSLIHRSAFERVGLLDERLRRLEDLEWFMRLGLNGGRLRVTPSCLAWIDVDANAVVGHVDHAVSVIEAEYLEPGGILPPGQCRRNLAAYLALEQAVVRMKMGRRGVAIPHLFRSWFAAPRTQMHLRRWWSSPDGRQASTLPRAA